MTLYSYRLVCEESDEDGIVGDKEYLLVHRDHFSETAFRRICNAAMKASAQGLLQKASKADREEPRTIFLYEIVEGASDILEREHGFRRLDPTTVKYRGPHGIKRYWGLHADPTPEHSRALGLPKRLVERIIRYNESLQR
jgi:hypothetical protein